MPKPFRRCSRRLLPLCALMLLAQVAPAAAPSPERPAPALDAVLLDGRQFSLAAHRGEVVIVNYWATWCEPCRAELSAFDQYLRVHPDAGLTVLAVSMDDPEDLKKVRAAVAGFPFAVAMSGQVRAEGYGRIWRLPMSFVIDRGGVLRIDGGRGAAQVFDLPTLQRTVDPLLDTVPVTQKP